MAATLSMFSVVVDDMATSLAFYRRLGLDIPAEADGQPHAEITLAGGLRLGWDTVATVRGFEPEWQPPAGGHRMAIAFELASPQAVDDLYAQLVGEGYTGIRKPWDAVWGQRYALIADPDGTSVDLFARLA
jgi:catechol 2,3-dioxygenase-like lactoylglutathione lyase family enzyme